jgi:hypothetical protein
MTAVHPHPRNLWSFLAVSDRNHHQLGGWGA